MHLRERPVEDIKREFSGFKLDANKIEMHSVHKRKILLPYFGPLPAPLLDNDGAYISVGISAGLMVGVGLII